MCVSILGGRVVRRLVCGCDQLFPCFSSPGIAYCIFCPHVSFLINLLLVVFCLCRSRTSSNAAGMPLCLLHTLTQGLLYPLHLFYRSALFHAWAIVDSILGTLDNEFRSILSLYFLFAVGLRLNCAIIVAIFHCFCHYDIHNGNDIQLLGTVSIFALPRIRGVAVYSLY